MLCFFNNYYGAFLFVLVYLLREYFLNTFRATCICLKPDRQPALLFFFLVKSQQVLRFVTPALLSVCA